MDTSDITTKCCRKCGNEYPVSNEYFYKAKHNLDGLTGTCSACLRAYNKQTDERRRERHNAYMKQHRATHAEQFKERERQRYQHRAKQQTEYQRQRRQTKAYQEHTREWRKRPDVAARYRMHDAKRRARENTHTIEFAEDEWKTCLNYFESRCAVCGRFGGLWHFIAADHWIPLTSVNCPGTIAKNIVPLCHGQGGCNNSKSNRDPNEWLEWKFGKRKAKVILKRIQEYFDGLA